MHVRDDVMRRAHLPIGEDGYRVDDPFDDLRNELELPDEPPADPVLAEARREAQIAEALAILSN